MRKTPLGRELRAWKRNDSRSEMRKSTLGHERRDLYGNEMTMGHKWEKDSRL